MNYISGMEGGTGDGTAATYKGLVRQRRDEEASSREARALLKADWERAYSYNSRKLFVPSIWSAIERSTLEYPE